MRSGGISATNRNYTGQILDGTGLLYYHARYYDPGLGRFVSPDSIVPGAASGAGGGAATLGVDAGQQLKPLTVDFHEPGFVSKLNGENQLGFWFQLSDEEQQQAGSPWGPLNPQALNRYSYVLNNPVRYVDPTGHWFGLAAMAVEGALAAVGITLSAPAILAIAAVLAVSALIVFLSDANNREWLSEQIANGVNGVEGFANDLNDKIQGKQDTVLEARKGDIKFVDRLAKKYNLTREQRRELHDEITKKGYTEEEIEETAKDIADRDGNNY